MQRWRSPAAAAARAAPGQRPHRRGREGVLAGRLCTPGHDPRRQAGDGVVHRQDAQRQAADAVQDRVGPAHRRAPDHRPRRPRLHHPSAPAGGTRRPVAPDGHVPRPGPLPGPRRRSTRTSPAGSPTSSCSRPSTWPGAYHPKSLPSFTSDQTVDGYHIDMHGHPKLQAIQAQFVHVNVTDPQGKKVTFVPWFGALAHAIFFHQGIARLLPHARVRAQRAELRHAGRRGQDRVGTRRAPGKLTIGVLLPEPGHLEAVPADEARRQGRDRPLHAEGEVVTPAQVRRPAAGLGDRARPPAWRRS